MTQPTLLNYVTCSFGVDGAWAAGYHTGIDYRAAVGTKIHATKSGKVHLAGTGGYGSAYGQHVVIQHAGVQSLYAHLSRIYVKPGQKVKTGQVIGLSGDTGNTSGPHLHYEERVSPYGYYNHRRPRYPTWKPLNKKFLRAVQRRLGIKK